MNYCGIICEYNPLHTGHAYQLQTVKALDYIDGVICVMSGNFVQRAEPAIVSKAIRTRQALLSGADAVIQIPSLNTVTGGERFAASALGILSSIGGLRYLAFGCETKDFIVLEKIAKLRAAETDEFKAELKSLLNSGFSYPRALSAATLKECVLRGISTESVAEILDKPNNILAIEYLKVIYQNNYDISPIFIHRENNYNSSDLTGQFASATAIREHIQCGRTDDIKNYVPYSTEIFADNLVDYSLFERLLLFSLRKGGAEKIAELADCAEGLEHKLYENALKFTDIKSVLDASKSKRYTYMRLKRIALQSLLSITKSSLSDKFSYGKLLGIRESKKSLISKFGGNIITTYKDAQNLTDADILMNVKIDVLADDIYSLLINEPASSFFKSKLIKITD